MLKMNISIQGMDGLRHRLGLGGKTLDSELRPAISVAGKAVRDEAKSLAVGRRLPNSVQMRTLDGGLTTIIGSVAATALSIEKGREPGDVPRVGLIAAWMNRTGIVAGEAAAAGAVQSVKTHRVMKRGGRAVSRAQLHLAWKIAMAIGQRGTKPLPFIIPAAGHKKDEVGRILNAAVGRALHRIAVGP